ncbi:hypothetical protein F4808DRAFT_427784 [Astrocystis sublimbata]|nr:hypothetical protein F4808DRAFT_427784 [Astrocystis sublimbata]
MVQDHRWARSRPGVLLISYAILPANTGAACTIFAHIFDLKVPSLHQPPSTLTLTSPTPPSAFYPRRVDKLYR